MPYSRLLKDVIKNSNYSHKYIIEKLEEKNIHVDKSYLSKLINGKQPAPREEISRAIAQICNYDERILVVEGYFDKAPNEIKDLLNYIRKLTLISSLSMFDNNTTITKEQLSLIEAKMNEESISEFLISILDYNNDDNYSIINGNLSINSSMDNVKLELEEPLSFIVKNDDMFPIIPKNSHITIELTNDYKNGDIVALNYNKEIITRYYFNNNGIITYTATNKNSIDINANDNNLKLLGKVRKVIQEIQ